MKATPLEIQTYYDEYIQLPGKLQKGAYIESLSKDLMVDKSTIHRWFKKQSKGKVSRKRADRGKPRKSGITDEIKSMIVKKVAALKIESATKTGKVLKTEMAVLALFNAGEIPCIIPEGTMNRWLDEAGMSWKQIQRYNEVTNNRLVADYPNQWWFVDSSVSELYYLGPKNNIIRDNSGILTDKNHRDEILTSKGYRKLLIFCAVDLYSHAWVCRGYITPGESAASWTRFLMDIMEGVEGAPLRGIPENIYSDKGSGLLSNQMQNMLDHLNVEFVAHTAGRAMAKGLVERRIGLYKANIESALRFDRINSIERYNEITTKLMIEENTKSGKYSLWNEIHKFGKLKEFTPDLRRKVSYKEFERKVNAFGCISLESNEFFVSNRLHGEWVTVYRKIDGTLTAIDRRDNRYTLEKPDQEVTMGKFRSRKKTEFDYSLDELTETGKDLRKKITADHFISGSTDKITQLPIKGEIPDNIQTPFDKAEPIKTLEDTYYRIYLETKISKKYIPQELQGSLDHLISMMIKCDGGVIPEKFTMICELITDALTTNYKEAVQ